MVFGRFLVETLQPALQRSGKHHPPLKKHNLPLTELVTLAIFRFFTHHRTLKAYYAHLDAYRRQDSRLPDYVRAMNKLSFLGAVLVQGFMNLENAVEKRTLAT